MMVNEHKLTGVLSEIIDRWGIPGLGVGIVDDGEIVYARCFGVQSLDTGVPVSPDSFFCVASITKCFVATAIMQLVEQGNLCLDAPIVQYLPDFRMEDERHTQITLRQMLSHTSGMPDMDENEYDELVAHPEYDEGAPERYLRSLASRGMIAAPGERFAYSNITYNVLGYLIAKRTGLPFEETMHKQVLRPAGMPESTLYFPDVPRDRLAVPHLRVPRMIVNPIYPYHRADAPASFLHSTVREMCQWAITCLSGGTHNGKHILSPSGFDEMWKPVAEWGFPPFYEHIGLGWTLGHFDGVKTVSHGGMGFGWTDFLTLMPEKNRGMVILCNEESSARSRTIRAVIHAMLEKEPIVSTVSWMVPITHALDSGGVPAAYACYDKIKDNEAYFFEADELVDLTYQIQSVKQFNLAIEVLKLNLHVFPQHIPSYLPLAKLYRQTEQLGQAETILRQALAVQPDQADVLKMLFDLFTLVESNRLYLRRPEEGDCCTLERIFCDPSIMRYLGAPWTSKQVAEVCAEWNADWGVEQRWSGVLVKKDSRAVIGTAGLTKDTIAGEPGFELSWFVLPEYQNQGFATEIAAELLHLAFDKSGAERVVAETHPENPASNRLLEKLGFTRLGLRHNTYDDLPGFDTQVLWEVRAEQVTYVKNAAKR